MANQPGAVQMMENIAVADIPTSGGARPGATEKVSILNLADTVPDATIAVKGIVELATNAETIAGTDATLATTPQGVAAAIAAAIPTQPEEYIVYLEQTGTADPVVTGTVKNTLQRTAVWARQDATVKTLTMNPMPAKNKVEFHNQGQSTGEVANLKYNASYFYIEVADNLLYGSSQISIRIYP